MKLTKGVISRAEAEKISPEYVRFAADWGALGAASGPGRNRLVDVLDAVLHAFAGLRKGQRVVTYRDGEFVVAKVTSVDHLDPKAVDGPVVRVGNGEFTWRVDGAEYAFPAPEEAKAYGASSKLP